MTDRILDWISQIANDACVVLGPANEADLRAVELRLIAANTLADRCEHQNLTPMCREALNAYREACK